MTKTFRLSLVGLVLALAAVLTLTVFNRPSAAAGVDTTRDCDETAIIHCGVMTLSELKTKYAKNEAGDLPAVYKAFGVTNFDGFVDGVVWRDGRVTVGDKVVATGAMTAARNMPGADIPGSSANVISPSVWPAEFISGKPAFVKIVNGEFAYAVLKTCGNPVKAKPVVDEKPKPFAACVSVTPNLVERGRYTYTGKAETKDGATISQYTFETTEHGTIVDTTSVKSTSDTATTGTITLEPGTYKVNLIVQTSVGDKTGANCIASIAVPEEDETQVCDPETGDVITVQESEADKYKPVGDEACELVEVCEVKTGNSVMVKPSETDSDRYRPVGDEACEPKVEGTTAPIPSTGPTDLIAGGIGISSLTAAGYYWRASRRRFIDTLLNR